MNYTSSARRLAAIVLKDLLCLCRDKAGLTVLFVMPLALLLVMTLVQNAVISSGPRSVKSDLLLVNMDKGAIAEDVVNGIASNVYFNLRREIDGRMPTPEQARRAVLHGDIHACLIIPKGFSEAAQRSSKEIGMALGAGGEPAKKTGDESARPALLPPLEIVLDPTIPGALREGYMNIVSRVITLIELRTAFRILGEEQGNGAHNPYESLVAGGGTDESKRYGGIHIRIRDGTFVGGSGNSIPTVTQQNVPAWTMFAMFFIVVPLATQMIRERNDGTLRRSLVAPVAYVSLTVGKIMVYGAVCVAQFVLLCAAGMIALPWFGLAPLTMGTHPLAILPVVGAAALAACGFGVLIGTVARSHVQASAFGAVVVIILAAIGGVMVPVYVMPHYLQTISNISPLAWGLDAFLDIFMREGTLSDILPETCGLLAFFGFTCVGALLYRLRYGR